MSIPVDSDTRWLESQADYAVSCGDFLCFAKGTSEKTSNSSNERSESETTPKGILSGTPTASILSDVVEGHGKEGVKNTVADVDKSHDDAISTTSQTCDGRYRLLALTITVVHIHTQVTCYACMYKHVFCVNITDGYCDCLLHVGGTSKHDCSKRRWGSLSFV